MDQTETEQPHTERNASPIAGCLIFCILILVFSALGGFIVYTYFDHKKAVTSITEGKPETLPALQNIEPNSMAKLNNKLTTFSTAVLQGEICELKITAYEINLAISRFEKMQEFQGKLWVTSITKDAIQAKACLPMKANFSQLCYMNGDITLSPVIAQGSLFPKITSITPNNGNPVPEKMIKFLPQALFSAYRNDTDLKDVFHKLSSATLHDGYMLITSDPNHIPMDNVETAGGDENLYTGLAIFGIVFFIVFSSSVLIYFVFKRRKKQKATTSK